MDAKVLVSVGIWCWYAVTILLRRQVGWHGRGSAALSAVGVEPRGGTPEAMGALLAADTARWAEVIERAGIERQG
jgi:hypothetical protein